MKKLYSKAFLIGLVYLIHPYSSFAANLPPELIGTWGPSQEHWGNGDDGRPVRCDASYKTGNNPEIFYGFFPDGQLAAGMFSGPQCKLKSLYKTSNGYSAVLNCLVEATLRETHQLSYSRTNPPQIKFDSQVLYKCRSTP